MVNSKVMENISMVVKGKVQGVGFRYNAKKVAVSFGLSGYVKNLPDGSVFIEAEGSKKALDDFIHWCHHGPDRAIVHDIKIEKGTVKNHQGFETRF